LTPASRNKELPMQTFTLQCEFNVPDHVSENDVLEWVRFELHDNGRMEGTNPLKFNEFKPVFPSLEIYGPAPRA